MQTKVQSLGSQSFGERLAQLRPIAHALMDPHFEVALRPMDEAWALSGISRTSAGFNPTKHICYMPRHGVLAQWLSDPAGFDGTEEAQRALAYQTMLMAHDYMHCWAYRLFRDLYPGFRVKTPQTLDELEEQAFFLILSENVATVGTDYWYLSRAGLKQRCGTAFDMGPLTIQYFEKNLSEYRKADPSLTVQEPGFFERIFTLYGTGELTGFGLEDLEASDVLAAWIKGELRISTHQRSLALNWLAYLGGLKIDAAFRARKFAPLVEQHAELIAETGRRLWQKIRYDNHDFLPIPEDQGVWTVAHEGPADCLFTNLNQAGDRDLYLPDGDWKRWDVFVDQTLSGHKLPNDPERRAQIRHSVNQIRETGDHAKLTQVAQSLTPLDGDDPAPLALLFSY